jgi:hypothetical protein
MQWVGSSVCVSVPNAMGGERGGCEPWVVHCLWRRVEEALLEHIAPVESSRVQVKSPHDLWRRVEQALLERRVRGRAEPRHVILHRDCCSRDASVWSFRAAAEGRRHGRARYERLVIQSGSRGHRQGWAAVLSGGAKARGWGGGLGGSLWAVLGTGISRATNERMLPLESSVERAAGEPERKGTCVASGALSIAAASPSVAPLARLRMRVAFELAPPPPPSPPASPLPSSGALIVVKTKTRVPSRSCHVATGW